MKYSTFQNLKFLPEQTFNPMFKKTTEILDNAVEVVKMEDKGFTMPFSEFISNNNIVI